MRDTIGYLTLPDGGVILFCKAPYAAAVNLGYHRGGGYVAANPFLFQAWEFFRSEMMKAMRGLLEG
jgi:hypothetical protein